MNDLTMGLATGAQDGLRLFLALYRHTTVSAQTLCIVTDLKAAQLTVSTGNKWC